MATNDSANRPLGWALIGCGGAGNGHARGASDTPDVEVRGFCDVRSIQRRGFRNSTAVITARPIRSGFSPIHRWTLSQSPRPTVPTQTWRLPPSMPESISI